MIHHSLKSFDLLVIFRRLVGRFKHNRYNATGFPDPQRFPICHDKNSMIRKIVLSNFMAHAQTELKLADGLTVLVGPNNIGKSTVALAIKILARNTNSNFVMQHEQKECSILVETSDGHSIEWIKRKSPSYKINGQPKDRLGRGGTPPELDVTLRLAPVEFEDKDFEPHFGDQKSPIFLINRPASQIAQFFSTTSDAEKLVAMQRLHQRNRTETQSLAKLLAARNNTVEQSLNALEEVPQLQAEWESLERDALSLQTIAKEIAELESLVKTYVKLTLERQFELYRSNCLERLMPMPTIQPTEHLKAVVTAWDLIEETKRYSRDSSILLSELVAAPKMDDETPLTNILQSLNVARAKFDYCDARLRAQAGLAAPCKWISTDSLQRLVEGMSTLVLERARLLESQESTRYLTDFPSLQPEGELTSVVGKIAQLSSECRRLGKLLEVLSSIVAVPAVADPKKLFEAIQELERTIGQFAKNQSLLDQLRIDLLALESDAAKWLSTEPTCNTCGGKLSVDSLRFKSHRRSKVHE